MITDFYKIFSLVAILVGTMVGVGIFAVPYALAAVGPIFGLFLLFALGILALVINDYYGKIVLRSKEVQYFVGYVEDYLGSPAKEFATFSIAFGILATITAYVILGGGFLQTVLGSINLGEITFSGFFYSLLFWALGAFFIYLGLKSVSTAEIILGLFLVLIVGVISISSLQHFRLHPFTYFNFEKAPLAYGVFLTALAGYVAIPEMREIALGTKLERVEIFRRLVFIGTFTTLALYLFFGFAVVANTGLVTSSEAIAGLEDSLGPKVLILGAIFGVLACFSSFLTLGVNLKKVLIHDWNFNSRIAWAVVVFVPLAFYLVGFRDFVGIIGLAGAVMGGINSIIIVLMYNKVKGSSSVLRSAFIFLFLVGILSQLLKPFL